MMAISKTFSAFGLAIWLGVSVWIGIESSALAASDRKPNIVVFLADDMGFADVGFNGCRDIPTPNIDSLARGGVRCSNGYVSGPYCSPTRAGLLTGRYQQRFGHEFNPGKARHDGGPAGLPLSETTIADRLKAAGYATGLVGKWHLGGSPEYHPLRRGFDEFYGFLGGARTYDPSRGAPIYRGIEVVEDESAYLTDAFGREAASFIGRHKEHPFFLELAFNAVHTPMEATDDRLTKFAAIEDKNRRAYAAMLSAMDDNIGKVLNALRAANLEENTLIFFFSDNGGATMLGTTINASRNDPFRGSKRTTLEGGIHVPFVVQWKGTLPAGAVYDRAVIQLDILPTVLAAAGVSAEPGWKLDGVDLVPFLKGGRKDAPHPLLFWRLGGQNAIRRGDWKLVRYDDAVDRPGVRSNQAQGIAVTPPRLYHLGNDPGEKVDLASKHPDTVRELSDAWKVWDATLIDPLWGPLPKGRR
jgi:arylsulfatase A-like enzyme